MSSFAMCDACDAEYHHPTDRRFHAEAIACHGCGPKVSLVRLDGHEATEGRADATGRYVASLGSQTPIRPGAHELQVSGDGFTDRVTAQLSPAAPLAQGPARSQLTPAGLRVDWLTPGGGVQSTLLVH